MTGAQSADTILPSPPKGRRFVAARLQQTASLIGKRFVRGNGQKTHGKRSNLFRCSTNFLLTIGRN
jgi:hypothetical protein